MRSILLAAALSAAPAAAQAPTPSAPTATAPVDPARLAVAERVAARVMPEGTYARMFDSTFSEMIGGMMGGVAGMDMGAMADAMGPEVSAEAKAELKGKTLGEIMAEKDPHWAERERLSMGVMMAEMKPIMASLEPTVRTALAKAYARKFTLAQLQEYERFFATPAGSTFAESSLTIWMDPEIMGSSMAMMPMLMERMPEIAKKMEAATAHLPPPPKENESEEEQEELPDEAGRLTLPRAVQARARH